MTRAERLAIAEANAKRTLETSRMTYAQAQSKRRAEERKVRTRRQLRVGTLASKAGLFDWDDATLAVLFALLATLREVPDPVALLEALLCDSAGLALGADDGMAEAQPRVSAVH